ncbi:MAG: pantetheine-phosphate adenylyltransferase [Candidatus Kapaibacterium sp.]
MDVIERAAKVFDKVFVVIGINSKKNSLFTQEERLEMVQQSLAHEQSVEVAFHSGLIVDYAVSVGATAIIRGLRSVTDFEFEMQIALMNRKMQPELQTVFLMPHEKYTYLSSSIIREIARYKQNVSEFVPKVVEQKLKEKFGY